jgi:ABC-type uncharacterized transport system fused permease/ATPase subunit
MTEIAVVYGMVFVIIFYFFFTKEIMDQPKDNLNRKIFKSLRLKDVAVFFHLLGAFLVVGFIGLLLIMSQGQTYYNIMETFFTVTIWLTTGVFGLYLVIYIIFRLNEELTTLGKLSGGSRK